MKRNKKVYKQTQSFGKEPNQKFQNEKKKEFQEETKKSGTKPQ